MAQATLFEIEFRGLEQMNQRLEQAMQLLHANLEAAVASTVLYGAGRIAEDTPVDTGRLRASIGGDVLPTGGGGDAEAEAEGRAASLTAVNGLTGVIGTNVHYARYVEFGFTPTGPRELTEKQRRYLFAAGILRRGPGGRVIPGDVNRAINRRAGIRFRVKGKGMFRKNIPAIRRFFLERCQEAVSATLRGERLRVTY